MLTVNKLDRGFSLLTLLLEVHKDIHLFTLKRRNMLNIKNVDKKSYHVLYHGDCILSIKRIGLEFRLLCALAYEQRHNSTQLL
jgi:hypothetical protein